MTSRILFYSTLISCAVLTACAPSLKSQYADVAQIVGQKTGQTPNWDPDRYNVREFYSEKRDPKSATNPDVTAMLAHPLSLEDAIRLTLINNPKLQAELAGVGVSRAELIQAGLFKNPQLFLRYRKGTYDPHPHDYELRMTEELMSMLTMPLRRNVAKEGLEGTKAQIVNDALDLAIKTEIAYYTLQADMETRALEPPPSSSKGRKLDLQILADREALNRLMGLYGSAAEYWTIATELPEIPPQDPPCEGLEDRAVQNRLDLAALRSNEAKIARTIKLQKILRWVPIFNVGVDYERKSEDQRVIGPVVTIELPIFDWGQGNMAKLRAQLAQFRYESAALENEIRSEFRESCARLKAARESVASLENAPASDPDYIEALRDYWVARAKMSQAIGSSADWGK